MLKTGERRLGTHRRGWRATTVGAVLAVVASALIVVDVPTAVMADGGSSCGPTINSIACENSKPGTDPSVWDIDGAGDADIQGFATDISVNAGSRIDFKVDTTATSYKIDIFRTGYYQGLGARYITSVPVTAPLPQRQPQCLSDATTELYDCGNWGVSASWTVPSTAVSGVYIAKLTRNDNGDHSHIIFIVRNDGNHSDVVFQTSDPTWQAYNTYGGADFYQGGANGRAYKISYNRPFATRGNTNGRDFYFSGEYAMVRFLERNGYDVSYMAGVDTDRFGAQLLNHKVFLSVGHDEYWSAAQRANVTAARDAGVNLQFLSGNEIYWHTRYEASSASGTSTAYRTLVSYKETWGNAANPNGGKIDTSTPEWTGTWRDPRFATAANGGTMPENGLTGTMYMSNDTDLPVTVSSAEGKTRLWRNTSLASLAAGTTQALAAHTVGYESDEDVDNGFRPAGLVRLSTTVGSTPQYLTDYGSVVVPGTTQHHVTLYKAPSGALVFGAGTIQWAWGLDQTHDGNGAPADARMQQAQVNILADMSAQPTTLMNGLVATAKTSDTTAPSTTITSPAAGASIANGTSVTVTGTASDSGGVVAGVEVSTDGGTTWHPATGTTAWNYTYIQQGTGTASIIARAIDDSANYAAAGTSRTVSVTGSASAFGATVPATPTVSDTSSVELGLRFVPDTDGFISGVRFYKGTRNTGTHVGSLWSGTGARLGTVTFTGETATGWQTAKFAAPIAVDAGAKYTVSYTAPNGGYAADPLYWPYKARPSTPVTVPSGVGAANPGVYGDPGTFPTDTYQDGNYYVDVLFDKTDNSPLKIVSASPVPGSSSNLISSPIVATLNRAPVASSVSVTVKAASGATVAGTTTVDTTAKTIRFTPTAALDSSVTYTVTMSAVDSAGVGFAAGGGVWSFSTAAQTLPDGTCPCSLYPDTSTPVIASAPDTASVTLGVRFSSTLAGTITALRFYKGPGNTGSHVGTLWSSSGTALASVTFTGESTQGWQTGVLSAPVSITANTQYIASYTAPVGGYSVTAGAYNSSYTRGPLQVPANGAVYTYAGGFPNSTSTTDYGVDVVFQGAPTGPVVVSATPASGSSGVSTASPITVTFNSAVSAATVSVSSAGAQIAGSTAFSSDGKTVTFTPSAALPAGALISVSVTGVTGANGVAGSPVSWSFQTAAAQGGSGPITFFGQQTITPTTATNDNSAVILGMSFTTSTSGTVSAIRYFKAVQNTGTHIGWLWGTGSTPLATVTFQNETSSGWQRAVLDSPVTIDPGQTYTVSYLAPNGNYSYQSAGLASAVTSGPLTTVVGANGLYSYGTSGRPTSSWNSTNYFVDVEFTPGPATTPAATLFGTTSPDIASVSDTAAIEVGTRFTVAQSGTVTALRYYRGAGAAGAQSGSLWSSDGTRLAQVTFSSSSTGWVRATLSTPVAVSPGQTYTVSYFAPQGGYAMTRNFFTSPVVNGDITGTNGVFLYAAGGGFPTQSYQSSAYFADVEIAFGTAPSPSPSPSPSPTPTPTPTPSPTPTPALTATTPASGATGVDPATAKVTATLTNATSAAITLTAGTTTVAGTSSFDAATGVASFTPTAALGWTTSYTATVTANGAAVAGGTWSFTTMAKPDQVSLFPTGTPSAPNTSSTLAIQVATRFTASAPGVVTAIRFYKGSSNTGTHTGYLWRAGGTRLATVTFTGETASGWQTAVLSTPVRLTVGTEYRVGMYSTSKFYALTTNGLSTVVTNGPISTLATGGAYSNSTSYPSTTSKNKYWVDIIFDPDN